MFSFLNCKQCFYKVCILTKGLCWMYSLPCLLFVEVNNRLLNSIMTWKIQTWRSSQERKVRCHQSEQVSLQDLELQDWTLVPWEDDNSTIENNFHQIPTNKACRTFDLLLPVASNVWTIIISLKYKVEQEMSFCHIFLLYVMILQL